MSRVQDSEESIKSLMDVTNYNQQLQNKPEKNDETENLVDLLQNIGKLDKNMQQTELR